jgi:1,4-dihydroxy-2-naphthoate octaprenyltransferase
VLGVALFGWPAATLATLLVAPLLWAPWRLVLTHTEPRELLPALGATARALAVYGAVLALGLAAG